MHQFYYERKQSVTINVQRFEGALLHLQDLVLDYAQSFQNLGAETLLFVAAVSSKTSHFSSCIVCVCVRCFKYLHRDRSGTVRSSEIAGHGDTRYMKMLFVSH
jgi:tartrate dehydratase alpha subunit/fumarate hydratase class I-like protein